VRKHIVPVAALFTGPGNVPWVKEATNHNDGRWVEAMLRLVGHTKGAPWCAAFVCMVLDIAFKGANPLPATASCDVLLEFARKQGWLQETPIVGDVFLVMRAPKDAVHTGIVTGVGDLAVKTIEGNTNAGGSRDGWGVFARERRRKGLQFIRIPDVVSTEVAAPLRSPAAPAPAATPTPASTPASL
jgi:hypothetical protein